MVALKCDVFMQVSAPCHRSKKSMEWFNTKRIKLLCWSRNSHDLNPIENLWGLVKEKVANSQPESLDHLKRVVLDVWENESTHLRQICVPNASKNIGYN